MNEHQTWLEKHYKDLQEQVWAMELTNEYLTKVSENIKNKDAVKEMLEFVSNNKQQIIGLKDRMSYVMKRMHE